jgi:hypothetical protein
LPSPDQISQIIIDPDSLRAGSQGPRIEIVTRPGTGRWEGGLEFGFADESLNARTPGEIRKEPRQTRDVELEARGPLVPSLLETTFEYSTRSDERAGESLRAITPAGELFTGIVRPESGQEVEIGGRIQLNASHRLDVEFARETNESANRGVGGFRLPERGSEERQGEWTLQVRERLFRQNVDNNLRFQVRSRSSREEPLREGFAIDVADAFMSGGGTTRRSSDDLSIRLDDTLRLARGSWNFEMGGHVEYRTRRSVDRDNFNGTFEFASLHDYCAATGFVGVTCAATEQIVADALAQGTAPVYLDARGVAQPITGVPTTFTQSFGRPELEFSEVSFRTHIQADRRFGERASLGLGLEYNGTNHSRDFLRLNPNASVQYRLTGTTLVSAGARLTFDDFTDYERLLRNDGATYETELSISSPSFPDPFQGGTVNVGADTASSWVLAPDYRSPYRIQPQASVTQQVPGGVRLTLSYSASHGRRQRRTRNINAPLPGTPLPEEILALPAEERREIVDRMRPLYPHVGNVTQIETTGRSINRTIRLRAQPRGSVGLFGLEFSGNVDYTYRTAHDDNDFNNPWLRLWGPSRRDHQVQSRFRLELPDEVTFAQPLLRALARATYQDATLNFRLRANSGRLYSILSGRDLNGDQSTRDRPPGVARNTEVGPASWTLDMTLTKDVRLSGGREGAARGQTRGGEGRGGDRRGGQGFSGRDGEGRRGFGRDEGPRLRIQARVNNLLNHTHVRAYGSVVTSPLFGLPTGFTNGRTVSLSMGLDF